MDAVKVAKQDVVTSQDDPLSLLAGGRPLLSGQTVVLTGATGGIGKTIARGLALAGANIALVDLEAQKDGLRELSLQLRPATQTPPVTRGFNASDPTAFDAFIDHTEGTLGPVTGLINCAGLWKPAPLEDLDAAKWDESISANLATAFSGCRAVLPRLRSRQSGSIVLVASTAGEYGSITPAAHYAAAKGGVIALTKSLAREAGSSGVRVNAVSPGPIETAALLSPDGAERSEVENRTLLGRLGTPEEIACACVFLLSPLASFITGHVLRVNGGSLL